MKVAAGLIVWRDGQDVILRAIASVRPYVDEVVLVDGIVAGIDTDLPAWTELDWLPAAVHVERVYGATQGRKRNVLLGAARRLGCEWLLQIDADERLENGAKLRPYLNVERRDYFPIPFRYAEGGAMRCVGWKCLRVPRWRQVLSMNGYMQDTDGRKRIVWDEQTFDPAQGVLAALPWISHHPDERPAERRAIRLAPLEDLLEQRVDGCEPEPPVNFRPARLLQTPGAPIDANGGSHVNEQAAEPVGEPTYYCTQCGARYGGPGLCENGHPASEVVALSAEAAAITDGTAEPDTTSSDTADAAASSTDGAQASDTTAAPADATSEPKTAAPSQEPAPAEVLPVEQANLGLASTGELLAELTARAETGGYAGYRTVQ